MNTVIIVGASSGIGLALAQRLVSANAVINISRESCPVAGVENLIADVTDGDALAAAFARIPDADALVYCAGTSMAAAVECVHTDDYKRLFAVNLLRATRSAAVKARGRRQNTVFKLVGRGHADSVRQLLLGVKGGAQRVLRRAQPRTN